MGYSRGAVHEVITVFAFTLSALAAVVLLPLSGPLARHLVHPSWAANAAAVVAVFAIVFVALRIIGQLITARLDGRSPLGAANRLVGLAFGVVRALVVFGVFYLVFSAATPRELTPRWVADSALFPLCRVSGEALEAVLPGGLRTAGRFAPTLERAVKSGFGGPSDSVDNGQASEDQPPEASKETAAPPQPAPAAARRAEPRAAGPGYGRRSRESLDALVERSR